MIIYIIPLQYYQGRFISEMSRRLENLTQVITQNRRSRIEEVRGRNSLNGEELLSYLYGQGNYQRYIKPTYDIFDQNKEIYTHHNIEDHTIKEQRKEGTRMSLHLLKHLKLSVQEPQKIFFTNYAVSHFDVGLGTKALLTFILYSKSIYLFQNKEVHKVYLEKARTLQDIGCFCLTEFHHGSYSKGIQTLATYNHESKSFVLSTQGSKGMKYWIGALSQFANVAIIWAQVIVKGKSYGPHPFIAEIRCKKTRKTLPGITIGDCGPKNGLNLIDNGYLILDNFILPKDNLLGKYGDIDNQGNYKSDIKSGNQRFGLFMSALSGGRGAIALGTCGPALNALTIALRYSCGRKQFDNPQKTDEIIIIDYAITKHRIIPNVAQTLMQMCASIPIGLAYFSKTLNFSDEGYISQLHAISASLKAYNTWNNALTAEDCRSILGGHGYSTLSRISALYHDSDVNVTWQGDNNMLLQQTSKYLMKVIPKNTKTTILDLSFVHKTSSVDLQKLSQDLRSLENLQVMIKDCFTQSYKNAQSTLESLSKIHKDKNEIMLHFHPQAGNNLSLNYIELYIFSVNKQKIKTLKTKENIDFLLKALNLWTLTILEKRRYGNYNLRREIQKQIIALCHELTEPSIIALDILAPSSFIIGSPFANFSDDGFKQYVNLLYTNKDTFRRIPYYRQFLQEKAKVSSVV